MNFSPSEKRTRHKYIERTVENYLDVLDYNDATDGYVHPETSARNREIIDNFVVPNVRNGVLNAPAVALDNEGFIPIWAAVHGERFVLGETVSTLTPEQIAIARVALAHHGIKQTDQDELLDSFEDHPVSLHPDGGAMVTRNYTGFLPLDSDDYVYVFSRPILFLGMSSQQSTRRYSRGLPHVLHHELTHVDQSLSAPVFHAIKGAGFRRKISKELPAYLEMADMIQELGRQEYIPAEDEQNGRYFPYALASTARDLMQKFGIFTPPHYSVSSDSEIVRYIEDNNLMPLLKSSKKNENTTIEPLR